MAVSSAQDCGWGWVVCCACFFSRVFTHGFIYSFGVIYTELLDYFQESKSKTAIIGSLAPAVCLLSGPVVAVFVNKFGCRVLVISGAFVAAISMFISAFAPNIQVLYVTLGVMTGIGYGLIYLPSIVAVSQHFTKRRAFATGIGVSGSGIGTFIFSPVLNSLIQAYTWQGAILIGSALLLNCIACGLVYRPINLKNAREIPIKVEAAKAKPINAITENGDEIKPYAQETDVDKQINTIRNKSERFPDVTIPLPVTIFPNESTFNVDTIGNIDEHMDISMEYIPNNNWTHANKPNSADSYKQKNYSTTFKSGNRPSTCELFKKVVSKHINIDMFKNTPVRVFLISTFFYNLGYFVPYIYLPDTGREAGIDEVRAAWLVSSVGITSTLGRIVFGYLSDRKGINRRMLYNTSMVICGVTTTIGPLLKDFWALLLYTMVIGFSSGVMVSLTSVILADIVGTAGLADAFGMNNFAAGVAAFAGPPLAGWLFDISGSYVITYICSGISIALSGAMLYFVPLCT